MRCRLTRLIVRLVIPLFICLILLYVSAPPRFLVPMANRTQNINTQLVVECGAYAMPTPEYQWIFNDTIITANRHLNLSSLSLGDQGFYTCVANNSFGSVSGKFYLAIQGKSFRHQFFKKGQFCNSFHLFFICSATKLCNVSSKSNHS